MKQLIFKGVLLSGKTDRDIFDSIINYLERHGLTIEQYLLSLSDTAPRLCSCCGIRLNTFNKFKIWKGKLRYTPNLFFACMTSECSSSLIKKSTNEYKIKVLGYNPDIVEAKNRARCGKGGKTKIALGTNAGNNNPMSYAKLSRTRGLSIEEVKEFQTGKAEKMIQTKRDTGFFEDKSNNPYSKDYWIKRGMSIEEALTKVNSRNHRRSEFWQRKGYSVDEAKQLAKQTSATYTLAHYQKKYDNETSLEMYKDRKRKQSENWNPRSAQGNNFQSSIAAKKYFLKLYKCLRKCDIIKLKYDYQTNFSGGEFFIRDSDKIYFYDLYIHSLKLIIEFNGHHVHPRKDVLTKEQWLNWKHAYSKKSADEIHEYDKAKLLAANKRGIRVIYIWLADDTDLSLDVALTIAKEQLNERKNHTEERKTDRRTNAELSECS